MEKEIEHLAIIMDGNRRWAQKRGLPKLKGHTEGGENLKEIGKLVEEKNIPYLTVFALSTENFKQRSERELNHIFSLMERFIDNLDELLDRGVKLSTIGNLTKIPDQTREVLQEVEEKTKDNDELILTLAVNYGGRDEIVRAAKRIKKSDIKIEDLTEAKF
ncbi:MAG: di-trans,poly-cis-decaprenylcistransferase, partial [Parcubacteria group bacterium QH_9_35_7]